MRGEGAGTPPEGVERTTNGLSFQEVREQYDNYLGFAEQGDGDIWSFEQWANENFYPEEVPQSMWEQISAAGRNLFGDESGAKQITRRAPPPPVASTIPEASITPRSQGVVNNGVETRSRNPKPGNLSPQDSWHTTQPTERNAPSDRQLATAEFVRETERRTGETTSGALATGRRLAGSREQRTRTDALVGRGPGAAVQRNVDATMRKAENTARVNPGAGSQTALRGADDAALSEFMGFFANAMTGGKSGVMQNIIGLMKGSGMNEAQTQKLILRTMDPAQTDQVIQELTQLVGSPDKAQQLIGIIRQAQSQMIAGASVPTNYEEQ